MVPLSHPPWCKDGSFLLPPEELRHEITHLNVFWLKRRRQKAGSVGRPKAKGSEDALGTVDVAWKRSRREVPGRRGGGLRYLRQRRDRTGSDRWEEALDLFGGRR